MLHVGLSNGLNMNGMRMG